LLGAQLYGARRFRGDDSSSRVHLRRERSGESGQKAEVAVTCQDGEQTSQELRAPGTLDHGSKYSTSRFRGDGRMVDGASELGVLFQVLDEVVDLATQRDAFLRALFLGHLEKRPSVMAGLPARDLSHERNHDWTRDVIW
jgi:hypothetical protein